MVICHRVQEVSKFRQFSNSKFESWPPQSLSLFGRLLVEDIQRQEIFSQKEIRPIRKSKVLHFGELMELRRYLFANYRTCVQAGCQESFESEKESKMQERNLCQVAKRFPKGLLLIEKQLQASRAVLSTRESLVWLK